MRDKKISLPERKQTTQQKNKEASPCIRMEASYMAELAVLLPFFAGFTAVLLFFLQALTVQQEVGNALLKTGRELSVLACGDVKGANTPVTAQALVCKNLKKDSAAERFIQNGRWGIGLMQSDFSGEYIYLQADYRLRIPFGLFGRREFLITQKLKCRKWTGKSRKDSTEGEIVWITPNGTVYHTKQNCSYLNLSVSCAKKSEIRKLRNQSGAKYYPCERCMGAGSSLVYITQYGDRYHSTRDCSRLKRTVRAVRRQSVKDRRACSKCGKG